MEHPKELQNGKKPNNKRKLLMASPTTIKQKLHILNIVRKPIIAYAYYAVPFSKPDVKKLDKILSKLNKEICNLPNSTANTLTHLHPSRLHPLYW